MMGVGPDLIRGPVGMVIGLVVWLIVFPLILGAVNGWYLQSVNAGVVSGERFDRVVPRAATDIKADERWAAVTAVSATGADVPVATTAYMITEGTGGTCNIGDGTDVTAAQDWYTPLGTTVSSAAASGEISGCKYSSAGGVFNAGGLSGLIEIILQAAGLAAPIALLFALGTFGTSFLKNMGNHPILAAVLTVISFLLVATLLNTFIPFLSGAFEAIDPNRFVMYDQGLGNVASVIGNFFGVVVVSSIMMVAWQLVQQLRGRNTISGGGGQRM